MRVLVSVLCLLPAPLWAEDIPLRSTVTAATLYPQGATVTRSVGFSAPAGQHDLILSDLPQNTPLSAVRVGVDGASMGSVTARNDYVPPQDTDESDALKAARSTVETLEQSLREAEAKVEAIRLEERAAQARIGFLQKLGQGQAVADMDAAALRDMVAMIGEETLAARQTALDARLRAEAADRGLADLRHELDQARAALRALVPQDTPRAMLAVAISTQQPTDGTVTVTYTIDDAGWQPVYDLRLTRDTGELDIERGAFIRQATGENWRDIALTLSTSRPSDQAAPSGIWPWLRRVTDPDAPMPKPLSRGGAADAVAELSAPQAAPMEVQQAAAQFDGLAVTYDYPGTVSVASEADRVRIALGTLALEAEIMAQAVPLSDDRAFLMADVTNTADELILPTQEARFYLDDRFVGQRFLEMIPAGGQADLSFGAIDGLRLARAIPQRQEGERGVFTRSGALDETVRITVENLTAQDWPVRLLDRVPYSEQDDLTIDWSAQPAPSDTDVDDKRGVLEWRFDLLAGDTQAIVLDYSLEWPDGKVLR
ncbi:MAG: mucoidy inhibitor MuiA family protein [Roseovarius gahaiensis]